MKRDTPTNLSRLARLCSTHQMLFAYAAADTLDRPLTAELLGEALDRYEARCDENSPECGPLR